jgi:tetratricopeptide (TPR) repeat protein
MGGTGIVFAAALGAPRVGPRSPRGLAVGLTLLLLSTACGKPAVVSAPMAPAFPSFEFPELTAIDPAPPPAIVERHQGAWNLLQAGQPRSAARAYADIIARAPAFFPARAGLGYSELAERNYKAAVNAFDASLAQSPQYIPALAGRVEALLASERPIEAIGALEALLGADPSRAAARTRLESLRLSTIDALVEEGRQARQRGELERAREAWTRALQAAPESAFMYRELAGIERQIGRLDDARGHALAALRLDERDAAAQLLLAEIESARGDLAAALAAFRRAQELDTRADYRARIADLERRQALAALPEAYRAIGARPQITRGDLAALAGVALEPWLTRAGVGSAPLVTDVRGHWAQRWILLTTAAGVMEVYPNHTFQASAAVRRSDVASLVQRTLERAAALDPAQAATRRPTSPATFSDLPPTHASYPAAAVAVGSGVMQADPGDAFAPQRAVTGAEASAIVERLAAQVLHP